MKLAAALFIPGDEPGWFDASELARGPWDPGAQHGGAPAALVIGAIEALPAADRMQIARVTLELLRPVPIGRVRLEAATVRSGRRVQLSEAGLWDADGAELVRARALHVIRAVAPAPPVPEPPPPPEQGRPNDLIPPFSPMFSPDAMELRFVSGAFMTQGPATAWFRLRVPVVEGAPVTALQRLAAAGDFGNGISAPVSWADYVYINPDLTLSIERVPEGEWIALESTTRVAPGGIGVSESILYDTRGRVGTAIQSLLVAPRG